MTTSTASEVPGKASLDYRRQEDFAQYYANNVQYQGSYWDLKLVFGELDQSLGEGVVVQHSAVTMSWRQAKLLLYFLHLQIATHESEAGRIVIPAEILPEFPKGPPPKDLVAQFPTAEKSWAIARKIYEQFIAENPEAEHKS